MTNQEKGLELERKCYDKLVELGFSNLSFTKTTDNGADVIGTYNGTKYVFQCKNHSKAQGNRCVQEVVASQKLYKANRSVVVSNSGFTPAAIALAKANNCILLDTNAFFSLETFPPANYADIFNDGRIYFDFDYDIVEKFEEAKRHYGRTPKWEELDKHLRYLITKKYKNYGSFLSTIGDRKCSSKPTDDELKYEYLRIKTLLQKVPTLNDIKNNSDFPLNSFHEYPITKLQRECGDRPNVERGVSKEELKKAYFELTEKLKRYPSISEIDSLGKYRGSYYVKRWGSIDSFLKEIGMTRVQAGLPKIYEKNEIVLIYSLIKNLFAIIKEDSGFIVNHTVLEKLMYDGKMIITPSGISKKFGGWNKFKEYYDSIDLSEVIEMLAKNYKK